MARRLVDSFAGTNSKGEHAVCKMYYDSDYGEYVVRLYVDGVKYEPADYFTDDREDAEGTAKAMVVH